MKKLFISALVALSFCFAANAQFVVKAGYVNDRGTISQVLNTVEYEHGFFVGGEYEAKMSDALSFAPGIEFAGAFSNNFTKKVCEFYLNVPVLLRLGFDLTENVRGFINAGPELFFGLASTTVFKADGSMYKPYEKKDIKGFDLMANMGAGIDIKDHFRVFGSYSIGLLNTSTIEGETAYNNILKFGVGYKF